MPTGRKGTGAKDRRIELVNYEDTQDGFGGPESVETERFEKWANVQDRSGNSFAAQAQKLYQYDAKVVIRYDVRVISRTIVLYEANRYKIESLSISEEGYKKEMILRCSKIETAGNIS